MNKVLPKIVDTILELLFPTTCICCGEVCVKGICKNCRNKLIYIQEPFCKKCGKPIRYKEKEYCYDCEKKEHFFTEGRGMWIHKVPVTQAVYQFKYKNKRIYGKVFAREMIGHCAQQLEYWNPDVIIPVPLSKKKKRFRGYNQAEILAREIGKSMGVAVENNAVIRQRDTTPQKQLNNKNRCKNLQGAFAVQKKWLAPKTVLLIDDIYTTGSTLNEIAKILKKSGVLQVYFLTISIGQGF